MSNILFIDCESTCLKPKRLGNPKNLKCINEHKWRMVSIGYCVYTPTGQRIKENYFIINCPFYIPPKSTEIHGINNKKSLDEGIDIKDVFRYIEKDVNEHTVGILVSHNIKFDRTLLLSEIYRIGDLKLYSLLNKLQSFCTSRGFSDWRGWQRGYCELEQAYGYLFSTPLLGHHHALEDAKDCADVYFAIKNYTYEEYDIIKNEFQVASALANLKIDFKVLEILNLQDAKK